MTLQNAAQDGRATMTPGATRAGNGRYVFEMAKTNHVYANPEYTTANGAVIEGDRMLMGLMHLPRGTGGAPHNHANEQWIYVLKGTLVGEVDGIPITAPTGSLIYIPADVVHSTYATADEDVIFFTAKDRSHGIGGTPVKSASPRARPAS
jgi:quercetin dioxygenase-like cupin family protein